MKLDIENWKPFVTEKLFPELKAGKANQQILEDGSECFYIGAKKDDNGVMCHCAWDKSLIQKGNCIIFICNGQGSVGYANYMDRDFIGTTDIIAGYNDYLNPLVGNFLATVYSLERPKYSFGRKWKTHLKSTEVKLPVLHTNDGSVFIDPDRKFSDQGFVPDWKFMEKYVETLHHKPIETTNTEKLLPLNTGEWKFFYLKNICKISMGNKMDLANMTTENPAVNFVGRSADNNGVAGKVDFVQGIIPYKAGTMTVALGGSLGSCYLQAEDFYTSQNVSVLEFENNVSKYAKIFISCLVMNESKYKYFPFGRELNTHIRTDFGFTMPVCHLEDGTPLINKNKKYSPEGYVPDWKFMENYIKSLPYSDRI